MSDKTKTTTSDDPHSPLNIPAVLSDVSVVVPTNRSENHTAKTVPDAVELVIREDDGRNVARNRGVESANREWIVIADDDIRFPSTLVAILIDGMHRNQLVGLEDFWPMRWVLTRFMIFHVSLWERVHGFQESRQHGGDTDFAIRCEKTGAKVLRLPRNVLPHYDVDTGEAMSTSSHIEWIAYLLRRHPTKIAPKLPLLIGSKLGLTSQSDMYPKEWNGLSYDMSPPINGSNADSK